MLAAGGVVLPPAIAALRHTVVKECSPVRWPRNDFMVKLGTEIEEMVS